MRRKSPQASTETARGKMVAWRGLCIEEINGLIRITASVVSEVKALRTTAKRVVGKIPQVAEKMAVALETDKENREASILEALENKHGSEEGRAIYDADDYPEFDRLADEAQRDEETGSLLTSIEVPDTDDPTDQAIEALDNLQGGLEELLVQFRDLK